jgi:hypothetical protein
MEPLDSAGQKSAGGRLTGQAVRRPAPAGKVSGASLDTIEI